MVAVPLPYPFWPLWEVASGSGRSDYSRLRGDLLAKDQLHRAFGNPPGKDHLGLRRIMRSVRL